MPRHEHDLQENSVKATKGKDEQRDHKWKVPRVLKGIQKIKFATKAKYRHCKHLQGEEVKIQVQEC